MPAPLKPRAKRQDLIDWVAEDREISKAEATKLVDSVLSGIVNLAYQNDALSLHEFGVFRFKQRQARVVKGFSAGKIAPPRRVLAFTPSPTLTYKDE